MQERGNFVSGSMRSIVFNEGFSQTIIFVKNFRSQTFAKYKLLIKLNGSLTFPLVISNIMADVAWNGLQLVEVRRLTYWPCELWL